jgi:hypothetical protein
MTLLMYLPPMTILSSPTLLQNLAWQELSITASSRRLQLQLQFLLRRFQLQFLLRWFLLRMPTYPQGQQLRTPCRVMPSKQLRTLGPLILLLLLRPPCQSKQLRTLGMVMLAAASPGELSQSCPRERSHRLLPQHRRLLRQLVANQRQRKRHATPAGQAASVPSEATKS